MASDLRKRRPIKWWWNFVGRTQDDITRAREDWMNGDRFGTVHGYGGPPIPAPGLPDVALKPRGRVG
ncbi:pirin-like C-terminal cupin domain-containing protein [Streptomyces sp. NBC_00209]|uniref:pirin-like C-terminal cupin domain-containing protein n=1 Tax=Streptomyces sp. NBC_00209 TaxID=2975682 RepID=UPI00386BB004